MRMGYKFGNTPTIFESPETKCLYTACKEPHAEASRSEAYYRFVARRLAQNREKNANLARALPRTDRIETAAWPRSEK